jgi:hypothetical protein
MSMFLCRFQSPSAAGHIGARHSAASKALHHLVCERQTPLAATFNPQCPGKLLKIKHLRL